MLIFCDLNPPDEFLFRLYGVTSARTRLELSPQGAPRVEVNHPA